jgi:hypothetical protein
MDILVEISGTEMTHRAMIPVWFFVGLLLGLYGVLIFASGLSEWSHPPSTVLAELHVPVWWGTLLTVIGGIYVAVYRPRNKTR